MSMFPRWSALCLLAVAVPTMLACQIEAPPDAGSSGASATPSGLAVEVFAVAPQDLSRSITLSAPVEPLRRADVAAQTAGVVTALHVEAGDAVAAGAVLAELDVREQRAELARARALQREQEVQLERLERLKARNYIDEASYSLAQTQLDLARADVSLWETRVSFGTVRAPMAGMITARHIEPGEAVSQHAPLVTLADFTQLVVRFGLSELDVRGIAPGDPVAVQVDALGDATPLAGEVRRILPTTESASRLVTVEVQLPAAARDQVRLGYLARTTLTVDRKPAVLAVPISAVGMTDGRSYVMRVNADNRLQRREVTVGVTRGNWREIVDGLSVGEAVVTSSPADLSEGEPVRIVRTVELP